ncbi:MAG: hypothetical protein HRT91_02775, partial [Piscirickettsiaceae bacterium]|nr:hypothetical protein [Piscirickettsiaceae bacterium]
MLGNIKKLLKCLRTFGGRVPGSQYERQRCKYEIQGLIYHIGMSHIFVTWNPADTHSTMVVHFGDQTIELFSYDDIEGIVPNARVRAALVADDPTSVAEFFHKLIRAAMHHIFGWIFTNEGATMYLTIESTFGAVRSLYGTIESQGRGSLHLHLLAWLYNTDDIETLTLKLVSDPVYKARFQQWMLRMITANLPSDDVDTPELPQPQPPPSQSSSSPASASSSS